MGYKNNLLEAWLLLSLLSACTTKKQETALPTSGMALPATETNSEQAESDKIAIEPETELTDSIAQKLFRALPTLQGYDALQPENAERLTEELRRCFMEYAATDTLYFAKYDQKLFPYVYLINEVDGAEYLSFQKVAGNDSVIIKYLYIYDYLIKMKKEGSIRIKTELENGKWKVADFEYGTYDTSDKSGLKRLKTEIKDRRIMLRIPEILKRDFAAANKYLNNYPDSLSIADPQRIGLVIEGDSAQVEQLWASGLTEERVKTLYCNISNNSYQKHPQEIFSPRLLSLVEAALAIPEDDLEGPSDKLELLGSLNFDYLVPTLPATFYVTPFNEDSVLVETKRIAECEGGGWCIEKDNHIMHLAKHDGRWLISSLINWTTDNDISRYISDMRKFYRSEDWPKECIDAEKYIEREKDSVKKVQMQEHLQNLKEQVKEYFEKYPDKP
jgi:hypothetical protein